jgi:hypothetical protein
MERVLWLNQVCFGRRGHPFAAWPIRREARSFSAGAQSREYPNGAAPSFS